MNKMKTLILATVFCSFSTALSAATLFAQNHIELASKSSSGVKGNDSSFEPSVSGNGRYVGFYSHATNLFPGDIEARLDFDYFIFDRNTKQTTGLFFNSEGQKVQGCSIKTECQIALNADGRYAALLITADQDPNSGFPEGHLYRMDLQTKTLILAGRTLDGFPVEADEISISADGRFISFVSQNDFIVPNDANNAFDCFVYDTMTGQTIRTNTTSNGTEANDSCYSPLISANGNVVVFFSSASNLADADINTSHDVFMKNLQTGETKLLTKSFSGGPANGASKEHAVNADGSVVAFISNASNLIQGSNTITGVYILNVASGALKLVPPTGLRPAGRGIADLGFSTLSISGSGQYVVFGAENVDLPEAINDANEIFLYDSKTEKTFRASAGYNGAVGNEISIKPQISTDGSAIVFQSSSQNLTTDDVDTITDVFAVNTAKLIEIYNDAGSPSATPTPNGNGTSGTQSLLIQQAKNSISEALLLWPSASKAIPQPAASSASKSKKDKIKAQTKAIKAARSKLKIILQNLSSYDSVVVAEIQKTNINFSKANLSELISLFNKAASKNSTKSASKKYWNGLKSILVSINL